MSLYKEGGAQWIEDAKIEKWSLSLVLADRRKKAAEENRDEDHFSVAIKQRSFCTCICMSLGVTHPPLIGTPVCSASIIELLMQHDCACLFHHHFGYASRQSCPSVWSLGQISGTRWDLSFPSRSLSATPIWHDGPVTIMIAGCFAPPLQPQPPWSVPLEMHLPFSPGPHSRPPAFLVNVVFMQTNLMCWA